MCLLPHPYCFAKEAGGALSHSGMRCAHVARAVFEFAIFGLRSRSFAFLLTPLARGNHSADHDICIITRSFDTAENGSK